MSVSQGRKIQIQCKKCSKLFSAFISDKRQYCSKKCWSIRGTIVQKRCQECDKVFSSYLSLKRQFCSLRCKQVGCGKKLKGRSKGRNPLYREIGIVRAKKWAKDNPKRRQEIVNKSNDKRMDKIVAWNRNHPVERNITIQKGQKKMRQKVIDLLGYHCALCGRDCRGYEGRSSYGLQFHEKNHKKHPDCDWWYILKHPDDFIPLCHKCHIIVTQMKTVFGVTFEELKHWLVSRIIVLEEVET